MKADSTHLRDDLSVMGFNLVTSPALRMHMAIELWIAERGMTSRYAPSDLLFEYSSIVSAAAEPRVMNRRVPANARRLEEGHGLYT